MKRPTPSNILHVPLGNVRKAFTRSQLAEAGAAVLAWNHLEIRLHSALEHALDLHEIIAHDVVSRIHGVDGIVALIRQASSIIGLSKSAQKHIGITMSGVSEYKNYRDAVAHAVATHGKNGPIVQSTGGRGKVFDVIFTPEALSILVKRIEAVSDEVLDVAMIFNYRWGIIRIDDCECENEDSGSQSFGQDVRRYNAQLHRHQKKRLGLPPLPAFPKELKAAQG